MKKILITLAAIVLAFTACKDDHVCPTPVQVEDSKLEFIGEFTRIAIYSESTWSFSEDSIYSYEIKWREDYPDTNLAGTIRYSEKGTWKIADEQLCEDATTILTSYFSSSLNDYSTRLTILSADDEWLNFHNLRDDYDGPSCAVRDRIRIK